MLDSFDRAAASVQPETEKEVKINEAYQGINKQFIKTLEKLNIEPIDAQGKPFDANIHAAIQTQDSDEYHDGVVITQYQRGYMIGDRLIRPSMCLVSSGPGPAVESTQDEQEPIETQVDEAV